MGVHFVNLLVTLAPQAGDFVVQIVFSHRLSLIDLIMKRLLQFVNPVLELLLCFFDPCFCQASYQFAVVDISFGRSRAQRNVTCIRFYLLRFFAIKSQLYVIWLDAMLFFHSVSFPDIGFNVFCCFALLLLIGQYVFISSGFF